MSLELMDKKDLIKLCREKEEKLTDKKKREDDRNKAIRQKDADIRKKDNIIKKKDDDIRKKDTIIRKKEDALQKKIDYFHNILEIKDNDVRRRNDHLQVMENIHSRSYESLRDREDRQRDREDRQRDREDRLRDREDYHREREELHREREDNLREKEDNIEERNACIQKYKEIASEREINRFLHLIHEYQKSESNFLSTASKFVRNYDQFFYFYFDIRFADRYPAIFKGKTLLWKLGDYVAKYYLGDVSIIIEFLTKISVMYIGNEEEGPGPEVTTNQSRGIYFEFSEISCFDWMHKVKPRIQANKNRVLLLNCLLRIHSSPDNIINEAGNCCEAISSHIFFDLFKELRNFLGMLNVGLELKVNRDTEVGKPNGILYDRKKSCMVIETRRMPLFKGAICDNVLKTVLKDEIVQITNHMIEIGCSRGIMTDSFKYILIEMEPTVEEQNGVKKMSLRYKYVNAHDMRPSLLEVLLVFIQESIDDEKSGKKVNELNNKYRIKEKCFHMKGRKF